MAATTKTGGASRREPPLKGPARKERAPGSKRVPRPRWGICLLVVTLTGLLGLVACGSDSSGAGTTDAEELPTTAASAATTSEPAPENSTTSVPASTTVTEVVTTTSSSEEATTTTSTAPKSTTTTEKLVSGESRLADGTIKVMGFIDRVWEEGGKRWIRIDYAEFLTGDEAREAAIKAGQLSPGEELPNDYFIRNESHTLREYQVSPEVSITTSTWHGVLEAAATWEEFKAFWSDTPPDPEAAHLKDSPWWIVRDGPIVLRIDEQYLP